MWAGVLGIAASEPPGDSLGDRWYRPGSHDGDRSAPRYRRAMTDHSRRESRGALIRQQAMTPRAPETPVEPEPSRELLVYGAALVVVLVLLVAAFLVAGSMTTEELCACLGTQLGTH